MPKRRRSFKRKPRKRRRFRRKRKRHRFLPIGGFAKSKLVRFRYVDQISINAPSGGIARHTFSANGLYDPNITTTGHQPSNFDVWCGTNGFYDHYTVLGSKIIVSPVAGATSSVTPTAYMGILKSDTGSRSAGMQVNEILEQKLFKFSRVQIGTPTGYMRNSVSATYSASKFFGKPKSAILGDDTLKGDQANNPPDGCFYEVVCASVNGNDPTLHEFLVEIEFVAIMSEPRPQIYS